MMALVSEPKTKFTKKHEKNCSLSYSKTNESKKNKTKSALSETSVPIKTNNIVSKILPAAFMTMSAFCSQYQQYYPVINEWTYPATSLYTLPVPLVLNPPILSTPIYPYVPPVTLPPVSPITLPEDLLHLSSYYQKPDPEFQETYVIEDVKASVTKFTIDYYLALPKDLFPSPNMLTMDPNNLIDEFCKQPNITKHASWILDLEYGVPKSPTTRHIPTYNVKFNSIHCKNTPDAIHPGFESCSQGFKKALLFYYDCIVSAWYRGYILLYNDSSVENFQSWLQLPMSVFGMCWSQGRPEMNQNMLDGF